MAEDGTETALEVTLENGNAAFLLDFDEDQTPVRVIRLVPLA